ncbi:unnamed protein product [Prorocentrum cordatum]|uniref:Uncharacterized protein n=1 Tax=Prorocentrum cordatum TaxID=2364126 RepID=A0ABN9TB34_9DINO|nr:unnamed protein product [Polarella glacialis]
MSEQESRAAPEREAPLIAEPISGAALSAAGAKSIHDVPAASLNNGSENAMLVFVDRAQEKVLLKVPNALGWRLHYGVQLARSDAASSREERWQEVVSEILSPASASGMFLGAHPGLFHLANARPAGAMLFTFKSATAAPMRVYVLEVPLADCSAAAAALGGDVAAVAIGDVPYADMWADDVFWLPALLADEGAYFEGHFVFDGGPGSVKNGGGPVVAHSYSLRDFRLEGLSEAQE